MKRRELLFAALGASACGTKSGGEGPAATSGKEPPPGITPLVEALLSGATSLKIYRLDPAPKPTGGTVNMLPAELHGYRILAQAEVQDAAASEELLGLVRKGIAEGSPYAVACFNPRHGITVTKPGKVVDLVICYECYQVRIHGDGMSSEGTSKSVEAAVNAFFAARQI